VASAGWGDWLGGLLAFQVHAVRDVLTVYDRYLMALASSRDAQAIMTANQTAVRDWVACIDGFQHELLALQKVVPADALSAMGWRLRRGALDAEDSKTHEGAADLLEQSRLGVEMLLRPWMPASDLDHTDEFVA
jgi:hypothetical protein